MRNLERDIARICRKVVKEILIAKKTKKITITRNNIDKYLGVKKFRYGLASLKNLGRIENGASGNLEVFSASQKRGESPQ